MILTMEPTHTVAAAIATLRGAQLQVDQLENDQLRVGNRYLFHVNTKFWKADDGSVWGYGLGTLISVIRSSP